MQVKGTLISREFDVQVAKNGGGTYPGSRFSYRDDAGAMKEKSLHANALKFNPTLKAQISNIDIGSEFVMTLEKDGEFWNMKSILPAGQEPPKSDKDTPATGKTAAYVAPKSTYETPEERAKKQVYIVRQSSINQAISYASLFPKKQSEALTVNELLEYASKFEAHVFSDNNQDIEII